MTRKCSRQRVDVARVVGHARGAGAAAVQHDHGWAAAGFGDEDRFSVDGDGVFGQVGGGHAGTPVLMGVMAGGAGSELPGLACGVDESVGAHHDGGGLLRCSQRIRWVRVIADHRRSPSSVQACAPAGGAPVCRTAHCPSRTSSRRNDGARVVGHPRLRDLPTDRGVVAGGEEALVVSGVGNPRHFQETGVHTGHSRQRAEHVIAHGGDDAVALGDDPADEARAAGDLGDVRLAFGLVGVEQRIRRLPPEHGGEFPAQVGDVADSGRHALADPRRHGMRGVAGQEDPPHPPSVGDADVVAVDHGPQDLDVFGGDALVVEHLPDVLSRKSVCSSSSVRAGYSHRW